MKLYIGTGQTAFLEKKSKT